MENLAGAMKLDEEIGENNFGGVIFLCHMSYCQFANP